MALPKRRQPALKFRKPPQQAGDDTSYLKALYWPPIKKSGGFYVDVEWHGADHANNIYDEKIEDLLATGNEALFNVINDNYLPCNANFKAWWRAQCTAPTKSVEVDDVVYLSASKRFVRIMDAIDSRKCLIYPGYEYVVIGSGKKINGSGDIVDDRITYINHDADFVRLQSESEFSRFFSRQTGEDAAYDAVTKGIVQKARRARKPKRSKWSGTFFETTFDAWLRQQLIANGVPFRRDKSYIRWNMSFDQAVQVFGDINLLCEFEIGTESSDDDDDMADEKEEPGIKKHWMEELKFRISIKSNTMSIRGVVLVENTNGTVDGRDLLEPEEENASE